METTDWVIIGCTAVLVILLNEWFMRLNRRLDFYDRQLENFKAELPEAIRSLERNITK